MNAIGIILALSSSAIVLYAVWTLVKEARMPAETPNPLVLPFVTAPAKEKTQEEIKKANRDNGYLFEQYVVKRFNPEFFRFKHWRSDKCVNGIAPESNTYPDLEYMITWDRNEIYLGVECKWRKDYYLDGFSINPEQIRRYKNYQREKNAKVFMVVGIGGLPDAPQEVFIVPLEKLSTGQVSLSRDMLASFCRQRNNGFYFDPEEQQLK